MNEKQAKIVQSNQRIEPLETEGVEIFVKNVVFKLCGLWLKLPSQVFIAKGNLSELLSCRLEYVWSRQLYVFRVNKAP